MATTINAGRVRFVSRGTYNNSTQYYLFDLVDYNGSSYIAKENTLGNLPTNTQYWQLIAEKGNTGSTGQTGPVGPTGNGIASITKTGTDGLVDTYTITYTNGNTTTFTITNGEDGEVTETELNVLREKVANQQKVINQLPQVEGQGTSITLENTIEAPCTKFDVEGNIVQDGTPSPDNEVPILSSGDNENLVNESNINFTYSSVNKVIYDNGLIKTINSPNGQFYEFDEPLQSGETYTLTFKFVQGRVNVQGSQDFSIGMYHSGNNNSWQGNLTKTQIANIDLAGKTFTLTHKATDTITGLYIFIYSSPTFVTPLWFNVKVEKGNKATPYSPYGMGSINEKIQTRNVFKNLPNTLDNYSIVMNNDGKKITFKGTNSSSTFYPSFIFYADGSVATSQWHPTKQLIDKSKGYFTKTGIAYILSLLKSGTFSGSNPSFFIGKETTFTSSGIFANVDTYTTQIANNSEKVNFIAIGFTPSQQVDLTFKIQLELGSTATTYVEHEEQDYPIFVQQPMRSIGDVRDCFVKKSDGWYERHYISKVVLDGTEPWSLQNDCFTFNISDIKPTPNYADRNQLITISNYYIAQTSEYRSQMLDLRVCKTIDGGTPKQIAIKDTSKTLAEFKAELAQKYANGKPVYVYYLLAEPLDLPCTETQIQQIENRPSTYKDFTYVTSEDETPAYLEVSGIYDLNKLINN